MALSLGDILAIVLGSILFLLLFGYLLYTFVFKNKNSDNISIEQMEECLRKNPNCRAKISDFIDRLEKDDVGKMVGDGIQEADSRSTENYQSTPAIGQIESNEIYNDTVLNQVERSMDMNKMLTTPVR